ncbi:hypothetical protein [Ulvibacterium sp.]|uniref:hypothetical protein n=1 Tax=Ulvibacterium sp. TaxID=2665914 RepID=UPI00263A10AB|nr:hypothetical protein [Ulvibacterium sp.]
MKKAFSILVLALSAQIINAHPSVENHSHDSILGQLAWIILPLIAIIALGSFYYRKQGKKGLE